jgi:hypothetical protein
MKLPVWNLLEARRRICQDVFPCGNEDRKYANGPLVSLDQNLLRNLQDLRTAGPPFFLDVSQGCGVVDPPEDVALPQRLWEDAVQEDPHSSTLQNIDMKVCGCVVPMALVKGPFICRNQFWMRPSGPLGCRLL